MNTTIIKQDGNETIKGNLVFRVLMNRNRLDIIRSKTYSGAVNRMDVLKKIFKYSKWDIVVELKKEG